MSASQFASKLGSLEMHDNLRNLQVVEVSLKSLCRYK